MTRMLDRLPACSGNVAERDQRDFLPLHERRKARIGQSLQFNLPFGVIDRFKLWIHVTGMTAQLGDALAQLRCKQAQQVLDADLFGMSLTVPLAVEAG